MIQKLLRKRGGAGGGFTLIELLVVIAIIAIIAILIIVNLASARSKGRDARRQQDLDSLRTAIESYNDDNGRYPIATEGKIQDKLSALVPTYLPRLMDDPNPSCDYRIVSNENAYLAAAWSERGNTSYTTNPNLFVVEGGDVSVFGGYVNVGKSTFCQ